MRKRRRRVVDYYVVAIVIVMVSLFIVIAYSNITKSMPQDGELTYQEFTELIDNQQIESVIHIVGNDTMVVNLKDGRKLTTINARYEEFRKDLMDKGVKIITQEITRKDALTTVVGMVPTLMLSGIFLVYFVKMMQTASKFSFNMLENGGNITFKDIAGMENIKDEVETAIATLVNADKLPTVGARPIRGLLLDGEPGCGKTLIAKAIAGEAKVPFISCSGSDFVEMFVGVGAARIRGLWKMAELNAPCVIFIDEIDALGKNRGSQHEESNRTLNALLQKMDGLETTSGILVVGATNLVESLDPALTRSGRFDKKIHIPSARTKEEREGIIKIHLRNKKTVDDLDMSKVVSVTNGLSGADIENILNDAVLISLSNNRYGVINFSDIESATLKLRTSGIKTNIKYNDTDKRIVAVHEAGHVIMAQLQGRQVDRVSIQAYSSGVGGFTQYGLNEDNLFKSKKEYKEDIRILLGGLVAEELILKSTTYGCSNDLKVATSLAYQMLFNWGMYNNLVSINIDNQVLPEDMRKELNTLLNNLKCSTREMLESKVDLINELAERLMKEEVIYDLGEIK